MTKGMEPEQAAKIRQSLSQGDEAILNAITEVQAEQKEILKENGLDYDKTTPQIGAEIPWSEILSMAFHIIDFDRNGTVISSSGDVKAVSRHQPYGYLLVEAPTLNQPVTLSIIHRDDFILAASIFDDPAIMSDIEQLGKEFLVTYQPRRTTKDGRSATPAHCLHYALAPPGTLGEYYANDIRMSKPEPKLLFGEFMYSGEISVHRAV